MNLGAILITLAIAAVVIAYIGRPVVQHQGVALSASEVEVSILEAEKERILGIIQEMDMDYAMGKITPQDFQAQREAMLKQGADVLRKLDSLTGKGDLGAGVPDHHEFAGEPDVEALIEAEVARLRGRGKEAATGFCAQCGQELLRGDRFCSKCGVPLKPTGEAG